MHLDGRLIGFEICHVHVVALDKEGEGEVDNGQDDEGARLSSREHLISQIETVIRLQNM